MLNFGLILQFIFVFGLIVFVHEFGHFLIAKMVGVDVEEFGFGYPPRLVKLFTRKGTDFTLNWIPFGGFVRLKGETDDGEPGGMLSAPKWKRFLILVGGATMNFVLGILLLIFLYNVVNPVDSSKILVVEVAPNSPAQVVGLQPGDIVTRLGDDPIDSTDAMVNATRKYLEQEVTLTYTRDGEELTGLVTPRQNPPEGQGAIGFVMSHPEIELNFVQSIGVAFDTFWQQVKATVSMPVNFIKGKLAPGEARVIGVKGIYDLFSSAAEIDQVQCRGYQRSFTDHTPLAGFDALHRNWHHQPAAHPGARWRANFLPADRSDNAQTHPSPGCQCRQFGILLSLDSFVLHHYYSRFCKSDPDPLRS